MDAVKFDNEQRRMFKSIGAEESHNPLSFCAKVNCDTCTKLISNKKYCYLPIEEKVKIVEKWNKEHLMTNAMKYKEVFGYEPKDADGGYVCPPYYVGRNCSNKDCDDCNKWWNEEYVKPNNESKED